MPIYEYACRKCEYQFEALLRGDEVPECPECGNRSLERLLSGFAVSSDGAAGSRGAPPPGSCYTCGDPRGPGT